MTSILRQIVAGPRTKHQETGLDLCYVTSKIIATSGPSQTYPQRAYRNPLDRLLAFLNLKHGDGWSIWEFRGEGTGYPDEAVYHRIRHYPWPDHHPPPFKLVPLIMGSMRNWLDGRDAETKNTQKMDMSERQHADRVVVVHCKAGKGRSGSMACSYMISECGWTPDDALARFTERRMRPGFGAGVTIPSQLRWVSYVGRWTKGGKKFADRAIEIVEVHMWGLRHGVKVSVEGFVDDGKKIKVFHTFKRNERIVVEGVASGGGGIMDLVYSMTGSGTGGRTTDDNAAAESHRKLSTRKSSPAALDRSGKSRTIAMPITPEFHPAGVGQPAAHGQRTASAEPSSTPVGQMEPGGQAVIFKPAEPIRLQTGDANICVERRNRARASLGLTMVTSVAHVWFNAFFEGGGPEQDGRADQNGVFEMDWDRMDGIKGSSQKGTRAFERLAVIWRVVGDADEISSDEVPQMEPADWKGGNQEDPDADRQLGLRVDDPESEGVSRASSVKTMDVSAEDDSKGVGMEEEESEPLEGVKTSGPSGEKILEDGDGKATRQNL